MKSIPQQQSKNILKKLDQSDTVISVFMKRDKQDRVPEWEEIAAVSMAIQNMWLTCYVNNIGCYLSTPGFKDEYGKLIGLNENEKDLLAFSLWVVMIIKNLLRLEMILIIK